MHLMDALGVIYPQYWLQKDAETSFPQHLNIIKAQYAHVTPFSTVGL
jgi:hypothetical protein